MKVSSTRLEVFVKLNSKEFERLKDGVLSGELRFYDDPSPPKNIPIEIIYDSKQKEFLKVDSIPNNVYFGEAMEVKFRINNEYYDFVNKNGSFSDRFFMAGKLTMVIEGRYTPY